MRIPELPIFKIISLLDADNLLPAILFRTSRKQCDIDVERLGKGKYDGVTAEHTERIRQAVNEIIEKYNLDRTIIENHLQYKSLLSNAIGAHHAGQLLAWRLMLEELMTRGLLRVLVATGTVAAGVDFPARTVLITAHSRRSNEGFKDLLASELQQMSGRAGRRGRDKVGFCLAVPGPYLEPGPLLNISKQPPEPLKSAYYASPSTVLNLLKYRNVDDLMYTAERSLGGFHDRKAAAIIIKEADKLEEQALEMPQNETRKRQEKRARRLKNDAKSVEDRQKTQLEYTLTALRKLGFINGSALSEKGTWAASLCTSLVLELAEALESGILEVDTPQELVALVGSIAGDSHRVYLHIKKNPIPATKYKAMQEVVNKVKAVFKQPSTEDLTVIPDCSVTLLTWMDEENWLGFASLLRLAGATEGDTSRLITQTADHLNQLSRLTESHPHIARLAEEGRRKILRPPLVDGLD